MQFIRNATLGDLAQIKGLALRAWLHTYKDIMTETEIREENDRFYTIEFHSLLLNRTADGLHLFKVLELDSQICGLLDFDFNGDSSWLMRFYVSPELIGRGYGNALLNHSEECLFSLDRKQYRLLVHKRNMIGIRFYERNGFLRDEAYDQSQDEEICYLRKMVHR
jgi:GNAT superfamily N-acetyltransferase